jgi:enoyl-CoA hydratase
MSVECEALAMEKPIPLSELESRLYSASRAEDVSPLTGEPYVLVTLDKPATETLWYPPNCPIVAVTHGSDVPDIVDVAVPTEADSALVEAAIERNPIASMVLVRLLRHNEGVDVGDRLFAESLAYSTLQSGAEFLSWLKGHERRTSPPDPEPPVLVSYESDVLHITLNRPHKRNAYSAGLRDALCEALQLLDDDPGISKAILSGAGACFSAGGDLDEFGEASDGALAHASRMTRSAGALIHKLRDRIEVHVHGACIGAGIELPAFASHIKARRDAFFQLPEVSMGLIPGAGGTASILPRIGRHRLAFMALTGARIDAKTALNWGLVDEIEG